MGQKEITKLREQENENLKAEFQKNHEELSKTIQSLKDDLKSAKEESTRQKEITKDCEKEIENLKEEFKKISRGFHV